MTQNKPHLYYPRKFIQPQRLLDVPSAWRGIELVLPDLIDRFQIAQFAALDLGVDYGFSTSALANYFDKVVGVDLWGSEQVDSQTGFRDPDQYEKVRGLLQQEGFTNVELVRADFRDYCRNHDKAWFNLIHADILHERQPTYEAVRWAVDHADLVLAHDTESYPAVKEACAQVAAETGAFWANWDAHFGLGILSRREPK